MLEAIIGGGVVLFLAAVGYAFKTFFPKMIEYKVREQLQEHKAALDADEAARNREHDAKMRELDAGIRQMAFRDETRFARQHERRIEVLEGLYERLGAMQQAAHDVVALLQRDGSPEAQQGRIAAAKEARQSFCKYIIDKGLYLGPALDRMTELYLRKIDGALRSWGENNWEGARRRDQTESRLAAFHEVEATRVVLYEAIKAYMRELLAIGDDPAVQLPSLPGQSEPEGERGTGA